MTDRRRLAVGLAGLLVGLALAPAGGVAGDGPEGAERWVALVREAAGHDLDRTAPMVAEGAGQRDVTGHQLVGFLRAMHGGVPRGLPPGPPAAGAGLDDPALAEALGYTSCATFGAYAVRVAHGSAVVRRDLAPVDVGTAPVCGMQGTRTWADVVMADTADVYELCAGAMVWAAAEPPEAVSGTACGLEALALHGNGVLFRIDWFGLGFDFFLGQRGALEAFRPG